MTCDNKMQNLSEEKKDDVMLLIKQVWKAEHDTKTYTDLLTELVSLWSYKRDVCLNFRAMLFKNTVSFLRSNHRKQPLPLMCVFV